MEKLSQQTEGRRAFRQLIDGLKERRKQIKLYIRHNAPVGLCRLQQSLLEKYIEEAKEALTNAHTDEARKMLEKLISDMYGDLEKLKTKEVEYQEKRDSAKNSLKIQKLELKRQRKELELEEVEEEIEILLDEDDFMDGGAPKETTKNRLGELINRRFELRNEIDVIKKKILKRRGLQTAVTKLENQNQNGSKRKNGVKKDPNFRPEETDEEALVHRLATMREMLDSEQRPEARSNIERMLLETEVQLERVKQGGPMYLKEEEEVEDLELPA